MMHKRKFATHTLHKHSAALANSVPLCIIYGVFAQTMKAQLQKTYGKKRRI